MARRVPALIFLGLALIVCVALAASESLTNRTGRTATAVTVTFSEQVRITSYDESVFPTKEPSNRSDTFTFSGGELENGGRFSISWTPSGAEITNTEWETTAAASGNTASSASLTYEQIMAQIAHYPGPDEPLYVPAEGEQIWLTDLEGHADIYDNDSIKIKYAPGFDKSQITRIDVYRNGVKLRFVPALFDVLTNEQMKTFDGNPAENTPMSNHTDHAIWGYEYGLRVYTASSAAVSRVLVTQVRVPFKYTGTAFVQIGEIWLHLAASDAMILTRFREMKEKGYAGVMFSVYYYMDSPYANRIFPVYEISPDILPSYSRTLTASELRRILRLAHEAGLATKVQLEIWCTNPAIAATGLDRSAIAPRNVSEWFANYTTVCLELVQAMNAEHSEYFIPMGELVSMEKYTQNITAMLDAIGGAFSGRLEIIQGTQILLADGIEYFYRQMGDFWAWTGVNSSPLIYGGSWFPFEVPIETQKDQRLSVMTENLATLWQQVVRHIRGLYPGHDIDMAQLGSYNYDGAVLSGDMSLIVSSARNLSLLDNQEFADYYAALLAVCTSLGFDEIIVWSQWITSEPSWYQAGLRFLDYTPAERTVGAVLK